MSVVFSVGGLIQDLRRQNRRLWRFANEAFGMSPMSFEKDLAPSGGELVRRDHSERRPAS